MARRKCLTHTAGVPPRVFCRAVSRHWPPRQSRIGTFESWRGLGTSKPPWPAYYSSTPDTRGALQDQSRYPGATGLPPAALVAETGPRTCGRARSPSVTGPIAVYWCVRLIFYRIFYPAWPPAPALWTTQFSTKGKKYGCWPRFFQHCPRPPANPRKRRLLQFDAPGCPPNRQPICCSGRQLWATLAGGLREFPTSRVLVDFWCLGRWISHARPRALGGESNDYGMMRIARSPGM